MNIVDAAAAIENTLKTSWSTPIAWENFPAKDYDSAGQAKLEEGSVSWISVATSIHGSRPVEVPISCVRYLGFLTVDIYTKEDTGTRTAMALIDELSSLMEFKTLSGVSMKDLTNVGTYNVADGWMTTVVQITFEFDRQL